MEDHQIAAAAVKASAMAEYAPAEGQAILENPQPMEDASSVSNAGAPAVGGNPYDQNLSFVATENMVTLDEAAQGIVASAAYPAEYASANGVAGEVESYGTVGVAENGVAPDAIGGVVVVGGQPYEDVAYSAEEDRLWNVVRANSLDFNAWTDLIEETEKVAENNITKIRKVYDAFLSEFPLCFGYWKKYADHEGRLGSIDKVVEVYERSVQAVTYSVDNWVNYCQFAISTYEDPDIIRRLFERGLAYVGTDYHSDMLWDEYIRYEESQQAWSNVAMIYTRILEHPVQQLDRYYHGFKDLTATRHISEIRTAEEAAMLAATLRTNDEGEVAPDGVDQSLKPVSATLTEAEELEKYISTREEMYKKAKEYDSKIVGFEANIRRPYFHVTPLDTPELENWHNYLDFMEREPDFNKVIKLYERCVIACALYPEFWIRYVSFMEASESIELANNALARATQVFVKKQPEIHLFAAKFKELSGDVLEARAEYQHLYLELVPGLLEAILRHAHMEYRLGDKESAFSVYEKAIATEREKEQSQLLPILLVQYSRFLYLVAGDLEKARENLTESLGQMQMSKPLLEAVIHLESIVPSAKRIELLDLLVEKFVMPDSNNPNSVTSASDREEISSIFLEFLDLFGNALSIKKAHNRHTTLFSRQRSITVSKKRNAADSIVSEKDKVPRTGDPGQSIIGAYPNAPSTYGQKSPAWPTTSQAQGQQWPAAYTPQTGYSAYGGYANYGQQMPQSVPQGAAYGAYPPSYTAQGYPQQSYAQPAPGSAAAPTATAAAFPQQHAAAFPQQHAAVVPQAYYGNYY